MYLNCIRLTCSTFLLYYSVATHAQDAAVSSSSASASQSSNSAMPGQVQSSSISSSYEVSQTASASTSMSSSFSTSPSSMMSSPSATSASSTVPTRPESTPFYIPISSDTPPTKVNSNFTNILYSSNYLENSLVVFQIFYEWDYPAGINPDINNLPSLPSLPSATDWPSCVDNCVSFTQNPNISHGSWCTGVTWVDSNCYLKENISPSTTPIHNQNAVSAILYLISEY